MLGKNASFYIFSICMTHTYAIYIYTDVIIYDIYLFICFIYIYTCMYISFLHLTRNLGFLCHRNFQVMPDHASYASCPTWTSQGPSSIRRLMVVELVEVPKGEQVEEGNLYVYIYINKKIYIYIIYIFILFWNHINISDTYFFKSIS